MDIMQMRNAVLTSNNGNFSNRRQIKNDDSVN